MPDPSLALDDDWVFVALLRCARCGRQIKLVEHAGDAPTQRRSQPARTCDDCRAR